MSKQTLNYCLQRMFTHHQSSRKSSYCIQKRYMSNVKVDGNRHKSVLTLYTKESCALCDEALDILAPYLGKVELEKVDITLPENRKWWNLYKYDIPVFHLNGEFLMKHRVDLDLVKTYFS